VNSHGELHCSGRGGRNHSFILLGGVTFSHGFEHLMLQPITIGCPAIKTESAVKLIPVAAYLRASCANKEHSVSIQKAAIEELARRHGYRIIRWYIDGANGSAQTQDARPGFCRLLRHCVKQHFERIICYDLSRLSCLNSSANAVHFQILVENHILLHTHAEGLLGPLTRLEI